MLALAYVLGVVATAGGVVYLAHRKMRVPDDGSWTADTASLADDVRAVTDETDYAHVQRRLVPLASRIDGHLRAAPSDASDELQRALHELGVECRSVGMELPRRDASEIRLSTKLAALDETARTVQRLASDSAE